ncbi:hypothetical protein IW261DRAFT_1567876 [Armillaria novae-zelandiae]|uniref:Uncharacterized protein n=1 Tax=Armillaria novae-zelandiae TaxID=153914 RepID=A0AA39U1C1_9AGAR|nr:hypothetical protein IW261DRAFT_1567876 [Armillaria novae-zelandiae]
MFPEDTKPKSTISPCTRLQGGFIMDCATAIDWASRIRGRRLMMEDIGFVWEIIERRVQKFGSRFSFVGPVLYEEFMIVMRRLTFPSGYLGMPPEEISRFHEAEKERHVKELLKDDGLGELVFGTRLD